jgi:homoserine dehydrogenase
MEHAVRPVRVWVVGLGTVGRWFLHALQASADELAGRYDFVPVVVGVANARDGFVHRSDGLDTTTVLDLAAGGRSIADHPGAAQWSTALEGLAATEADVLVEVTASPSVDGEPGLAHMREALRRSIPVVTSNKWPVALRGVELAELASSRRVPFRAESTVMSGTPVLSTLTEGLAGATPIELRGILNATANFILSRMTDGASYEHALAEAQEIGLAERDAGADVEGYDTMAKLMILAGVVFRQQFAAEEVVRQGITGIARADIEEAASAGARIKHVATLERSADHAGEDLTAQVRPMRLDRGDALAGIDGATNALVVRADPVGEVTIIGPGAGMELAGQGVFSDFIAVARHARAPGRAGEALV